MKEGGQGDAKKNVFDLQERPKRKSSLDDVKRGPGGRPIRGGLVCFFCFMLSATSYFLNFDFHTLISLLEKRLVINNPPNLNKKLRKLPPR